jgi:hypothetical protein
MVLNVRAGQQPPSPGLFCWNLQPLTTPQALDPLVVHLPSGISQHGGDPAIAVTTIMPGHLYYVLNQLFFVITALRHIAMRRTMLLQYTTGPALRDAELMPNQVDAGPATCGAQNFPFAASVNMSLSSVRSETALRRRSFSFCRRFNSLS